MEVNVGPMELVEEGELRVDELDVAWLFGDGKDMEVDVVLLPRPPDNVEVDETLDTVEGLAETTSLGERLTAPTKPERPGVNAGVSRSLFK